MLKSGHRLRVGNTSMIGWCIANQRARIALDVGQDAVRFGNPLLPRTRAELALPLISRGEVIGALGIQSDREADFSEEDIAVFQALADQLANAIRNAQLYDQLQRELTERRRAEKAIRKLNAELERRVASRTSELQTANERLTALSHLKDEFLANVSHELRTPLTSIMLHHDVLEKGPRESERYFAQLKRETRRLAHLIEELLYFSRLDQERLPFAPTPLDLNRLAHEFVCDRLPLAAERSLDLALEVDPSVPIALADGPMAGQVLSILMTNSMNYTPPGGSIKVSTMSERGNGRDWAGFAVSDTGCGVLPEERERLFERFYRGKAGRDSAIPGTGLGLAIAREIVERHGGRIEVSSTGVPGQGTTFLVWLPAAANGPVCMKEAQ
jgi:signal transduction histidine kinase